MSQTFSLSKETSLSLKGIFCIGIVLHHLAQRTSIGFLQPLCSAGTFLVAGFFFLSGYGLMAQLQEKRQRLPRRVFLAANRQSRPALCARHDFLCAVFLPRAWAARLFLSSIRSSRGSFRSLFLVCLGHYALYAAFALCFSRTDSPAAGIFRFLLFLSGYTLLCLALGFESGGIFPARVFFWACSFSAVPGTRFCFSPWRACPCSAPPFGCFAKTPQPRCWPKFPAFAR